MISCVIVCLTKYYFGDEVEGNEIGWACDTYEGEVKCVRGFGVET